MSDVATVLTKHADISYAKIAHVAITFCWTCTARTPSTARETEVCPFLQIVASHAHLADPSYLFANEAVT